MAARKLAIGAVAVPLVTGLVVGLTVVPATAASDDITSPPDGKVIEARSVVEIEAKLDFLEKGALRLQGPSDSGFYTVDEGFDELHYRLDPSCPDYAGPCSGEDLAYNGTYTVRVVKSRLLLSDEIEHEITFRLEIPPEAPGHVSIRAKNRDTVRLSWAKGREPDLTAYDVINESGARVKQVPVDRACDGRSCSTVVEVPTKEVGAQVSYAVRARRSVEPSSRDTVVSQPSDRVAVQLPGPTSSPTPSMRSFSRDGGSPPWSNGGSARPDLPDRSAGGRSTTPNLQPLASASRLALPDIARKSSETFQRRLNYPLPVLPSPTPAPRAGTGGVQAPVIHSDDSSPRSMTAAVPLAPSEWWKTVALGLVLLLVAAHLGAWTWRTRPVPASASAKESRTRDTSAPGRAPSKQLVASVGMALSAAVRGLLRHRGSRGRPGRRRM